jgi:hypothetical protein
MIWVLGLLIDYFQNQFSSMVRKKEQECLPMNQQADSHLEQDIAGREE